MKKRYRIWHLPVLSFYSKPLYRDVAARWKGTNLGYFCLLLAICLLPAVWNASRHTIQTIDRHRDHYLMQIPSMQLADGILSVNAPQPYSIIEGNRTLLLIDTSGKIQTLDDAGALSLLTQTELHIFQQRDSPLVYKLKEFNNFTLNQEIAAEMIARVKRLVVPTYFAAFYLGGLVLFIIVALLLGGMACLIATLQKKSLSYKAGVRIAVVALSPALMVGGLLGVIDQGIRVPLYITAPLYILMVLAYLYNAAGCARQIRPNELYLEDERIGS